MVVIETVKKALEKSVLCWLATASKERLPNVSPKEVFKYYDKDCILIANIASAKSRINIEENPNVCFKLYRYFYSKKLSIKGSFTCNYQKGY
ncbi:pyridoxamine 5'-phosphate oxidase family protein [Aquimarina agarivorans]|uniref:pyridoxamine 5'-phosphate oxidase family protein n=1 Tax=Aquimarina agarivorans TaxID=980584 RepID=UPI0002E18C7F|nr:pyridoxamine 5'-phosphate oxidase family protein [Aquimarina agarivorans]